MSIVDDFAAIGGRLAEIEKTVPAEANEQPTVTSWVTWMYAAPINLDTPVVVWTPEHGYSRVGIAPGAYDIPKVLTLSEVDPSADFDIYVAHDTDCA